MDPRVLARLLRHGSLLTLGAYYLGLLLPLAVLCALGGYPFTAYLLADAAADGEL